MRHTGTATLSGFNFNSRIARLVRGLCSDLGHITNTTCSFKGVNIPKTRTNVYSQVDRTLEKY